VSHGVDDHELEKMFGQYGRLISAKAIIDYHSGRSKGFGFVEMGSEYQAAAAISVLPGKEFDGRSLKVNEARPREERSCGGKRNSLVLEARIKIRAVMPTANNIPDRRPNLNREAPPVAALAPSKFSGNNGLTPPSGFAVGFSANQDRGFPGFNRFNTPNKNRK
jgi:cold-inducible RNA-binding protein